MLDNIESAIWTDEHILGSLSLEDSTGFALPNCSSSEWAKIDEQLRSFALLQTGWDGENASAPSIKCIDDARKYFSLLAAQDLSTPARVLPSLSGTIVAEWHEGSGYREIEFVGNGTMEIMSQTNPAAPFEHSIGHIPTFERGTRARPIAWSHTWSDCQDIDLDTAA